MPVIGDAVSEAGLNVTVKAVVGNVQLAAGKPLVERRVGVIQHLVPFLEPVQALSLADPPALPIRIRLLIDRRVVQVRVTDELGRRVEALDVEHRSELMLKLMLVARRMSSSHLSVPLAVRKRDAPDQVGRARSTLLGTV